MTEERQAVLITGASRGFGRVLLECYALKQWRTIPLVRDAECAERFQAELANCTPIIGDVTTDDVDSFIRNGLHQIGRLDVLINNAGISGSATQIEAVTPAEVNALIQTHCLGALRCVKAALPFMKEGKRLIINVTSRLGSTTRQAAGDYAGLSISYSYRIAKAGQNMFTVALANELNGQGFIVCGVHPGRLKTALAASDANTDPADAAERLADWIDGIDTTMNGKCFDLERFEIMKW